MEFLNISDKKLKVTLTSKECEEYGIDTTKSEFSDNRIRRAVREILALAKSECGFSVGTDKVLVQIYPLPDTRCELFVTRLTDLGLGRREREAISREDGLAVMQRRRGVYRFASFEDLLLAVKAVYREMVESDLYIDDLGRYYIQVGEDLNDGISEFEALVEFGERLTALPIAVLAEYGRVLAKGNAFDYVMKNSNGG